MSPHKSYMSELEMSTLMQGQWATSLPHKAHAGAIAEEVIYS